MLIRREALITNITFFQLDWNNHLGCKVRTIAEK